MEKKTYKYNENSKASLKRWMGLLLFKGIQSVHKFLV